MAFNFDAPKRLSQFAPNATLFLQSFGAVGDGIVDDTAAMVNVPDGAIVDLAGLSYLVSEIPTHFRAYNGYWKLGTVVTAARQAPLPHPLSGYSSIVKWNGRSHYWGFGLVYRPSTSTTIVDRTFFFYKPAIRHEQSYGSPFMVSSSYDRCQSFIEETQLFAESGQDVEDAACGLMDAGRVGAFFELRDSSTVRRRLFAYTDDLANWSVIDNVSPGSIPVFPYGVMQSFPGGYICFGYGDGNITCSTTSNNGLTWTSSILIAAGSIPYAMSEPSVTRIGNQNKWLMFIRTGTGNAYMSTSTDCLNWTQPIDTGIPLMQNPIISVYDGGIIYVYTSARNGNNLHGIPNVTYMRYAVATDVFDSNAWPSPGYCESLEGLSQNLGYFRIVRAGTEYITQFACDETETGSSFGSSSALAVISSLQRPSASPQYSKSIRVGDNLVRNPVFNWWSRGNSFTGLVANTKVADGWYVQPSGSTVDVSSASITPESSLLFPHRPISGITMDATANDFIGIYQVLGYGDMINQLSERVVSVSLWGYGGLPKMLTSSVRLLFDSATPDSNTNLNLMAAAIGDGVWFASGTMRTGSATGAIIGANASARLSIANPSNEAWSGTLCGVKLEVGDTPTPLIECRRENERAVLDRYVQSVTLLPNLNVGVGVCQVNGLIDVPVQYSQKRAQPSVSLLVGAATDLEFVGTIGTVAASAVSFISTNTTQCVMRLTVAGALVGMAGMVRRTAVNTFTFIVDADD